MMMTNIDRSLTDQEGLFTSWFDTKDFTSIIDVKRRYFYFEVDYLLDVLIRYSSCGILN
jgi:hypothetical protein